MNLPSAYVWPVHRVRAWAAALDAFAAAGEVAVAAPNEPELGSGIARSLIGEYADWAIVDLSPDGRAARAVAGPETGPRAAAAVARLAALPAHACPMIASAMNQQTPLVQAALAGSAELGQLTDGQSVSSLLDAGSCAVGPVAVNGVARGAITIVRSRSRPDITFLELSVLAHIADLAGAAVARLQAAKPPPARRWSFPR
jgi:GAF domain-containing protein